MSESSSTALTKPTLGGAAARRGCGLLLALAAFLVGGPVSTGGAEVAHVPAGSFSVPESPMSMAVDRETGSVYVMTRAASAAASGRIYRFDKNGNPENFSALGTNLLNPQCQGNCRTIAVDNSGGVNQGVIYVGTTITGSGTTPTTKRGVRIFTPSGKPSTEIDLFPDEPLSIGGFCGVSVDPQGIVYVAFNGAAGFFAGATVVTYKPGQILPEPDPPQRWEPLARFFNVGETVPCRSAAGPGSRLYLLAASAGFNIEASPVWAYTVDPFASEEPVGGLLDTGSTGIAVNQETGDVYSNHRTSILRLTAEGEQRETIGQGVLAESDAIAVNSTEGTVYAGNRLTKAVHIFEEVVTPDVLDISAEASQTSAVLRATVGLAGAGPIESCEFHYGTTTAYGSSVPCAEATPYESGREVSAEIAGLGKETTYHFRIEVGNADGKTNGPDRTFTTHNVADVVTGDATDITTTSATLNGSFKGNGDATTYYFEWGPTPAYGQATPAQSAGSPTGAVSVSAQIEGLSPRLADSQPYHYRLVASNSSGTTFGPDREFFTQAPDPPVLSGLMAQGVARESAEVSASIDPQGAPTVYWVEYGTSAALGAATRSEPIEGDEGQQVVVGLSGLRPGTTYHYRLVAASFGGSSISPTLSFNTPNVPRIDAVTAAATGETTATVEGVINPGFGATTYHVEYGLTGSYGSRTPETLLGAAGGTGIPVRVDIAGLRPGALYHARLIASNAEGMVQGPDATLTTSPTPLAPITRAATQPACPKGRVRRGNKCVKRAPRRCKPGQRRRGKKCVAKGRRKNKNKTRRGGRKRVQR